MIIKPTQNTENAVSAHKTFVLVGINGMISFDKALKVKYQNCTIPTLM
jgi:hypothetical protein